MSTRKRSRQYLSEDQDEDELSPTKNGSRGKEALGTLKKRKLNTYGSSPSSKSQTPKGNSLFGKLGGLLGFSSGKGKENVQNEEVDELSGDLDMDKESDHIWEVPEENDNVVSRRTSAREKALVQEDTISKEDIWEANTSDPSDDGIGLSKVRAKRSSKTTLKLTTGLETPEKDTDSIPSRSGGRQRRTGEPIMNTIPKTGFGGKSNDEQDKVSSVRRGPGRPRKSDILKKAKALSREAIRNEMSRQGQVREEEAQSPKVSPRRKSDRMGSSNLDEVNTETPHSAPVRVRRRSNKDLQDTHDSTNPSQKGILTPSKGRGVTLRKSVGFEEAGEVDLGFKDIQESTGKKQPGRQKLRENSVDPIQEVGDVDSDDSDDVACIICHGLDSEEPNEIILCDNCDNAFHQFCCGVAEVPEGEWLCRDCRPDVDDLLELDGDGGLVVGGIQNNIPDIDGFEGHLQNMKRVLLDKLTGQNPIKLVGHEEEKQKVYQVVEQTVLAGEGNSMLVIGARGCGKTNLVESVISDIAAEHHEIFHVVRLNGFIHTDDKLALKEIWRQLGREMEVDDDLTVKSNHADTLASLLALLSHPSEISENQAHQTAKSVIFVLDEFDLFTTHPRQTLLYNLFDIAQARKAPIVVLGLTTRVDVVDTLEKRVKSRFSHRYVHLSLPRSVPAFWEICKAGLIFDSDGLDKLGLSIDIDGCDEFLSYWQSTLNDLYTKDAVFKHHLQSHFYRTKSVPAFLTSCILPIANLTPNNLPLTGRAFLSDTMSLSAPDSKLHILQGLSELELTLLISAARLDIILDTDTCNFAMAYDEYCSLTSRHKIQTSSTGMAALGGSAKIWGKDVALGAWERLAGYELLVAASIGGGSGRDFGAGGRMWKVDVGLEEITGSVPGLSGVMAKWCREI